MCYMVFHLFHVTPPWFHFYSIKALSGVRPFGPQTNILRQTATKFNNPVLKGRL